MHLGRGAGNEDAIRGLEARGGDAPLRCSLGCGSNAQKNGSDDPRAIAIRTDDL
jgi:hypothetical protein